MPRFPRDIPHFWEDEMMRPEITIFLQFAKIKTQIHNRLTRLGIIMQAWHIDIDLPDLMRSSGGPDLY